MRPDHAERWQRLRELCDQQREWAKRGIKLGQEPKSAGQPPGSAGSAPGATAALSIVDQAILRVLERDPDAPESKLAATAGVTVRWVRVRLARMESLGLLQRIPVFERNDDPNWKRRNRQPEFYGQQTSNHYRLRGFDPPEVSTVSDRERPPAQSRTPRKYPPEHPPGSHQRNVLVRGGLPPGFRPKET